MNERDLFRALGDIDPELVEGAEKTPKKNPWKRYIPTLAAACICVVALFLGVRALGGWGQSDNARMESANGTHVEDEVGQENPEQHLSDQELTLDRNPSTGESHHYGDVGTMGNGTAPGTAPETELPADFTFCLDWGTGVYDSARGVLTEGTYTYDMELTEQELTRIWDLICQLESGTSATEGYTLTWFANGQQQTRTLTTNPRDQQFQLTMELMSIVRERANSIR